MSEEEVKTIIYVQTHGLDEPSKSATPFFLAAAAAAMDRGWDLFHHERRYVAEERGG